MNITAAAAISTVAAVKGMRVTAVSDTVVAIDATATKAAISAISCAVVAGRHVGSVFTYVVPPIDMKCFVYTMINRAQFDFELGPAAAVDA